MLEQIKWLWSNMDRVSRIRHITAMCISVVSCVILLVNPALSQRLIDDVIIPQNPDPLMGILMLMLGMKLLREGMRYLMVVFLEKDAQSVIYTLRCKLFEKLKETMFSAFRSATGFCSSLSITTSRSPSWFIMREALQRERIFSTISSFFSLWVRIASQ